MNVAPLREAEVDPPPPVIIQRYLSLGPPRQFTVRALEDELGSSNKARQFVTKATRSFLAVRVRRGEYVAIDPSVAIRGWGIPEYYAGLLVLHDALDQMGIDHAFACLPASEETDLVFGRPWVVAPREADDQAPKVERFSYDFGSPGTTGLEVLGETFELPVLRSEEAALVLAATGLPREVEAARSLIEGHPPGEELVPAFNYVGLDLERETLAVEEPEIGFPSFIEDRRESLSEDLLRGGRP